jgi:hypothetical protein
VHLSSLSGGRSADGRETVNGSRLGPTSGAPRDAIVNN